MLRLIVALLISLSIATPAVAADPVVVAPIDQVSRDKFPGEDGEIVDALSLFNKEMNDSIVYQSDQAHYGAVDHFVSLPADGKGDCEDYALSKLETLSQAGMTIVYNARLTFVVVTDGGQLYGHAIAEIRLPNGAIAVLDNNFDGLMTRPELERRGYEFQNW